MYKLLHVNNEIEILNILPKSVNCDYVIGYKDNTFYLKFLTHPCDSYILELCDYYDEDVFNIKETLWFSKTFKQTNNLDVSPTILNKIGAFTEYKDILPYNNIPIISGINPLNFNILFNTLVDLVCVDGNVAIVLLNCIIKSNLTNNDLKSIDFNEYFIKEFVYNIFKNVYENNTTNENNDQYINDNFTNQDMCPDCDYKKPFLTMTYQLRSGDEASTTVERCENGHFKNDVSKKIKILESEYNKCDDDSPEWFKEIFKF